MRDNNTPLPPEDIASGLDEISHALKQMLVLAKLSASDLNVNRDVLQKTLDRLKDRINQISDNIGRD